MGRKLRVKELTRNGRLFVASLKCKITRKQIPNDEEKSLGEFQHVCEFCAKLDVIFTGVTNSAMILSKRIYQIILFLLYFLSDFSRRFQGNDKCK